MAQSIEAYLQQEAQKDLLRFVFVGSVDDGKSTLIGRLLHDSHNVFQDHLDAVKKASTQQHTEIDFSLFTDGLKAEREQGITIDVAYRYFSTPRRKFIVADTPGHVQYTRNMVTGASTAHAAVILIDARLGVLPQSRRHAAIASLLGIRHLLVAINKMDLVGFDQAVFERLRAEFGQFAAKLRFDQVHAIPVSALQGDNVVERSRRTPWYAGADLLATLEALPADAERQSKAWRFAVQTVLRPHLDYRAYAGQIASGKVSVGDEVMVLPSAVRSRIAAIDVFAGSLPAAATPQAVALRLADEVDASRGDMLVHPSTLPRVGRSFDAHLVWLTDKPIDLEKSYLLKHTTQLTRAQIEKVHAVLELETLSEHPSASMQLNDIGRVRIRCQRALYYDAYEDNRATGAFILIDSLTNNTVGAGMIAKNEASLQDVEEALRELRAGSALAPKTQVSRGERLERLGQRGATVWLTGLPGSGRWPLAYALERRLFDLGRSAHVLDPSGEDLRSIAAAAKACSDAGLIAICAFPSALQAERQQVREHVGAERFCEIFVNTDPALCRERRPAAQPEHFEAPPSPALVVSLATVRLLEAADMVVSLLEQRRQFELPAAGA